MSINYAAVQEIENNIGNTRLMAVSKTRTIEEIMEVFNNTDIRLFGENHVQEIVSKFKNRAKGLELHMIGHLQMNKVTKVVSLVDMIESVDSVRLLERIDRAAGECGKVMDVLLEFNTSKEAAKSGFETREGVFECVEAARKMQNVRIRGLMTIGPVDCQLDEKETLTDWAFKDLVELQRLCRERFTDVDFGILSMGMSEDYMIGVRNGSTEVRIGTAIFGPRNYAKA